LKIFLVSDSLTSSILYFDARVFSLTPLSRRYAFHLNRPDLLLVESAWNGYRDRWKYGIASYPNHPSRNNKKLQDLVRRAKDLGIPTVFWDKEGSVHFERFIDSASLFDIVLTVDENCLPRYRDRLGPNVKLGVMPFAVQPIFHYPSPNLPNICRANFVGSYSHHIHDRRRVWQDMMFVACEPFGLTVYDRNSDRKASHYRYPPMPWMDIRPSVSNAKTADIYREYAVSLNVNTVDDSPTMFSRRLIEIVACGGFAVTNPSPSVDRYFKDYVQVVHNEEECREVLNRVARDGLSKIDRDRSLAGADYVLQNHTWTHRLKQISEIVGF
jgi:spore maturation protein CgeB